MSSSPETVGRALSRSSPRKPGLTTRLSGGRGTHSVSAGRLEPLTVPDSSTSASASPLLARSLSRPKKESAIRPIAPPRGPGSASLPRMLKLTPSPSPPPSVPLEQSAAVERQQALERKAALLTAQIKSRQQKQQQQQKEMGETRAGHLLAVLPERTSPASVSLCAEALSATTNSELASSHSANNVLTLDPTLHEPRTNARPASSSARSHTSHLSESHETDDAQDAPLYRGHILTDELLKDWTGWEDLPLVLSAEFRLDATKMIGLDQLGVKLPQLTSLKLGKSRVPQIRLLGTKFTQLKYLWLNNCQLEGLRGIGSCAPRLEELYASFNRLTDLTPLLDVSETLRVLDVEGNDVADVKMLSLVLPSLRQVTSLTLQLNPVESSPHVQARLREMRAAEDSQPDITQTKVPIVDDVARRNDTPIADRDSRLGDSFASGSGSDHCGSGDGEGDITAGEKQLFALREWIALLMPQLEYFDDIAVAIDEDGGSQGSRVEEVWETSATTPTAVATEAPAALSQASDSPRTAASPPAVPSSPVFRHASLRGPAGSTSRAKIRSTYVDPMDHALAEELRLVRECIREAEFDALDQTLETINGAVYSRPSTSCQGAVPRSRPGSRVCMTSSGRLGQPAGRLGTTDTSDSASNLTTGDVCAGSAIASLRRRLSPAVTPLQHKVPPTGTSNARLSGSLPSSARAVSPLGMGSHRELPTPLPTQLSAPPALHVDRSTTKPTRDGLSEDPQRVEDLGFDGGELDKMALFDDDEEGEWEQFKSALLADEGYSRRPPSRRPCDSSGKTATTSALQTPQRGALSTAFMTNQSPAGGAYDDSDHQKRYQQLKARMAAAASAGTSEATVAITAESQQHNAKESDEEAVSSAVASLNDDQGLSSALSRPSSGAQTLRIGSASLSQQHMLSALGGTTTAMARPARSSLHVVPMSGSSRRLSVPRSAGSQDRPASGTKSIGHDDSDDGFEGTLKLELMHARARLARSYAPCAGEDVLPREQAPSEQRVGQFQEGTEEPRE